MTAPEEVIAPAVTGAKTKQADWRRVLIFGSGLGIAVGAKNLELTVVRSRPAGPRILAAGSIRDFRMRPAAEWGAEVLRFLRDAGDRQLVATVLLPRDETIVRTLHLPGVQAKDLAGAIALQIETLHPYGDEEVAWAHMKTGRDSVTIGLVRKSVLDGYETLFSEAGIPVAAITFSPAVIHAALRIWSAKSAKPESLLCFDTSLTEQARVRTEIYGESDARAVYSATFSMAPERALALSRGELRLPVGFPACALWEALPASRSANSEATSIAYAGALAASAPLVARFANLLAADRRASNTRRQYLLPAILGTLLAIALVLAAVVFPAMEQRNYLSALNANVRSLEPGALQAQTLEKRAAAARARVTALDDFRRRPQADLDVLNELTRILPPPIWTSSIEIFPDSVVISGEAEQAAPLLKTIDSSPLFQNSDFALSVTHNGPNEQFRIKTMRRGRAGRTTP